MQQIKISHKNKLRLTTLLKKYDGKSYESFSRNKTVAYEYTSILGVRSCPYCNINYCYTAYLDRDSKLKQIVRPSLDHFIAKGGTDNNKNRRLQLKRSNLIPSCDQCNSRLKGEKEFKSSTHLHPLYDDFNSIKKFTIDLTSHNYLDIGDFSLLFKNISTDSKDQKKANRVIKDLSIIDRYQYHKEDATDLLKRAKFYHKQKISEIENLVGISGLQGSIFPDRTEDINSKPLAKLTNDLLDLIL